jgi:hypothetical protein
MEVIELTSTMGIHAAVVGVPILVEDSGGRPADRPHTDRAPGGDPRSSPKARVLEPVLGRHAHARRRVLRRLHAFSSVPWKRCARAEGQGVRLHRFRRRRDAPLLPTCASIRNAIGYGATREEIMEVIEIASVIGIHAATVGVPILLEELRGAARAS